MGKKVDKRAHKVIKYTKKWILVKIGGYLVGI